MKKTIFSCLMASIAITVLWVSGCKKKDAKPELYQTYTVTYMKEQGYTEASAEFKVRNNSGRMVSFSDRSMVLANGIQESTGMGGLTRFNWVFDSASDVTFTLRKDDKDINNTVQFSDVDFEIFADSVYNVGDKIAVSWTGGPLTGGSFIDIWLEDSNMSYRPYMGGSFSGEEYIFDLERTKDLSPGTYNIIANKWISKPLQQTDNGAGGEIKVFIGTSRKIVIK